MTTNEPQPEAPTPAPAPVMPSQDDMAVAALKRFKANGKSIVLRTVSLPDLNEAARRLISGRYETIDVLNWLNDKGGYELDDNAFYRFRDNLAIAYDKVVREFSAQYLAATLAADPNFNTEAVARFNQNAIQNMISQMLINTPVNQIDAKTLNVLSLSIKRGQAVELSRDQLIINQQLAEVQQSHLALKVQEMREEAEERRQRLAQKTALAKDEIRDAASGSPTQAITPERVFEILDKRMKGEL